MKRLWARVTKTADCWIWTGAVNDKGYGLIGAGKKGRLVYVHRTVWEFKRGPIPKGSEICHRCDNPRCVRLSHMFLGTHRDNMQDMAKKGRSGVAVVSVQQVREVVRLRKASVSRKEIAACTGINTHTLKDILRGKNWQHITGWSVKR